MTPQQTLYCQLENILRNNPVVREKLEAGEYDTGDTPAVEQASRRRAGRTTAETKTTRNPRPAAIASTGVAS